MEDVMISPLQEIQQWVGRSSQSRIHNEYARPPKSVKIPACKERRALFAVSVENKAVSRAFRLAHYKTARQWMAKTQYEDALAQGLAAPVAAVNTEARFRWLADEWSRETGSVSSVTALTSHPKYQEIINLGWAVVPYLLADLKVRRGFWFHALYEITKIRPFDPRDAGNSKRMVEAWLNWGKMNKIQF